MPRVKRRIEEFVTGTEGAAETATEVDEIETAEQIEGADEIAEIIENLEGATRARVIIQRRAPGKASFTFCAEMTLEDFKASGIADISKRFGGGKYQLKFKDDDGKWAGTRTIDIDERLKGELDQPAGVSSNGDSTRTEMLMKELSAKDSSTTGMLLQMMQMQSQQAAQALAAQAQQNQANLQLLTAAMGNKGIDWKQISAILAPLTPIALEFVKNRSKDATMQAIETLAKAKELFGDSGGDSTMESLLKSFSPLIAAKLGQQATPPPDTQQQVQIESAPANVVPLESPQLPAPEPEPNDPEMFKALMKARLLQSIRSYYPLLLKAAQKGSQPDSYLEVILDQGLDEAPEAALDMLAEMLGKAGWEREVFGVEALPSPEWFEAFRKAFLEWYANAPEEAPLMANAAKVAPEPDLAPVAAEAKPEKVKGGKK